VDKLKRKKTPKKNMKGRETQQRLGKKKFGPKVRGKEKTYDVPWGGKAKTKKCEIRNP